MFEGALLWAKSFLMTLSTCLLYHIYFILLLGCHYAKETLHTVVILHENTTLISSRKLDISSKKTWKNTNLLNGE